MIKWWYYKNFCTKSRLRYHKPTFGEIVDIYVSRKVRRGISYSFAFVRYRWFDEALKAIQEMHGKVIGNQKVLVSNAKPKKHVGRLKENSHLGRSGSISKPKYSSSDIPGLVTHNRCASNVGKGKRESWLRRVNCLEEVDSVNVVHGEVCKEKIKWLKRTCWWIYQTS